MPLTNEGARICLAGPGLVAVTRWLALFVGDPTSGGTEVSATGYARLQRTTAQMVVTNNAVSFALSEWEDSVQATWGTPTYIALMDAVRSGNNLAYGELSPALQELIVGARVFQEAGDFTVTIPLS